MEQTLSFLVCVGLCFFVVRYFIDSSSSAAVPVSDESVEEVVAMFPQIPARNVRYEIRRSNDVSGTIDRCLRDGYLPAPPPSFDVEGTSSAADAHANPIRAASSATSGIIDVSAQKSLLQTMGLSGEDNAPEPPKSGWATTPEEREQRLRQRKARMVLEARKKLLSER